ncbi:MAG: hypothetical protein LBM87_00340 [Ruminococcus sp.]|nr:hypothetical protein [Ruminococcus sp.]
MLSFSAYYSTVWDVGVTPDEKVLRLACDIIADSINVLSLDMTKIPDNLSENIYKAVCAEVDYLTAGGGSDFSEKIKLGQFESESFPADELCMSSRRYLGATGLASKTVLVA